jgi:GTPase SAR1 family protein
MAAFIPLSLYPMVYAKDVFCDPPGPLDLMFKVMLVGKEGCGKTAFLSRLVDGAFTPELDINMKSFDFKLKTVGYRSGDVFQTYKLQVWNSRRRGCFSTPGFLYRHAQGMFVCLDVNDRSSYEAVPSWILDIKSSLQATSTFIIVGMKADDGGTREVTFEEAEALANSHHVPYVECSSRDDHQVSDAVATLVDLIVRALPLPTQSIPQTSVPPHPSRRCMIS